MPKILFLDESGDHSLDKIDPQYPIFVLCGVIFDLEYHDRVVVDEMQKFKLKLFKKDDLVLHTLDFTRNKRGFELMSDQGFRQMFIRELESLIDRLNFKIVACVIKKQEHLKKYGLSALDPYMLSLSLVVERFIFECGAAGGSIVVEGRSPTLDNALNLAFLDLKIRGTQYLAATKIAKRIHNFTVRAKKPAIAGLEIADVVATPIGRHVHGKATYPKDATGGDFFETIKRKLRCDWKGNFDGIGLVVLPK